MTKGMDATGILLAVLMSGAWALVAFDLYGIVSSEPLLSVAAAGGHRAEMEAVGTGAESGTASVDHAVDKVWDADESTGTTRVC